MVHCFFQLGQQHVTNLCDVVGLPRSPQKGPFTKNGKNLFVIGIKDGVWLTSLQACLT